MKPSTTRATPRPTTRRPLGRQSAEEAVITSLTFPTLTTTSTRQPIERFDLGELHALVDRTGLGFAFGTVDDRGRLASRPILHHLGWTQDEPVTLSLGRNFIVAQADPTGTAHVDHRLRLGIPTAMLRHCGIKTHHQVLLVATNDDVLIVHPTVNVAQMIRHFHLHGALPT